MRGSGPISQEVEYSEVDESVLPLTLPILPLTDFVPFPGMIFPIAISKPAMLKNLQELRSRFEFIGFVAKQNGQKEHVEPQDLFRVGVCGRLLKVLRLPNNTQSAVIQAIRRFRISEYERTTPYLVAKVQYIDDQIEDSTRLAALSSSSRKLLHEVIQLAPTLSEDFALAALNMEHPGLLADFIAAHIRRIDLFSRQGLLETLDVEKRLERCMYFLTQEHEILKLGTRIQSEIREKVESGHKEYFLREQMRLIQKELGETHDDRADELGRLRKKILDAKMSKEAEDRAIEEINRLGTMSIESAEYNVSRNYIDWLIALPWNSATVDSLSLDRAKKVLDRDHFGLRDVKERILEFLAVKKLKPDSGGTILCFLGPPGVGKTSLGRSIAEAMGRKYARISLGGMRDEAEIKGHRKTYIGAMPGRLVQSLKRVGTKNPVFILDEIDKLGTDYRGDPASALLEALDPEQNGNFMDHYLNVPFDLSKVMFICTANASGPIPHALKDRMEIIQISGYIEDEKVEIARRHLIPKQLDGHGLTVKQLSFQGDAVRMMIRRYTREAGVRNLEREIAQACRKVARRVARGDVRPAAVTSELLEKVLGPVKFSEESKLALKPGVAVGLAYTPSGGELMYTEVVRMSGKNTLTLTGQLGEVIQESAKIALSYIRSRADQFGIDPALLDGYDFHIHFPANAIPKDGPSAGVTIATALLSQLLDKPIVPSVAMTGELSLVGQVLPVGGLKEKLIAAKSANFKTVIVPKENTNDLKEIPAAIRRGIRIKAVASFDEIVSVVL